MADQFPFVINDVAEEDIWTNFFKSMAHFDTKTLLRCRLVSKDWRDAIDRLTPLWSQPHLLWRAVSRNKIDMVQLIVEHAKDKNPKKEDGESPLHEAAREGYLEICQLIINSVKDKNPRGWLGYTPMHEAALNGHVDICRFIMDQVAEKNPANKWGETPLRLAELYGHENVAELIRSRLE